jgi:M6 family metalloprotease-like protein
MAEFRRRRGAWAGGLLCLIGAAVPCVAQGRSGPTALPTETPDRPTALADQWKLRFGPGWTVRLSEDSKRVASVVGLGTRPYGDKPESGARAFLAENAPLFGLRSDLSDLRLLSARSSAAGGHVEWQQIVNGLPVENAKLHVNLSKDGRVLQVVSGYSPLTPTPTTPRVTREQAIEATIQDMLAAPAHGKRGSAGQRERPRLAPSAVKLSGDPVVEDVYFATGHELRRAYKVLLRATLPQSVREAIVDAETGAVLRGRELIAYFDDATGQVFIPNPVNSLNNDNLTDANYAGTAGTGNNPNPYYTRQLLDLDPPVGGKYKLTGPFVTLEEIEGATHAPPSESSASFVYQRSDANFDDVMVYYHLDSIQRYIQLLGFVDVDNRRVRADSSGFLTSDPNCDPDSNGDCDNSHYVPDGSGTGYIAYGRGGVDDDEDADIIAHEYGHSIQDNSNPGAFAGDAGRAMGEGFGDYLAVSMFSAETVANGHVLACVGEWDATFYATGVPHCLRRVDTGKTMDDFTPGGDEHSNGEIWSQALFNIFNALGRTTADRLALQGHFNVPSSSPSMKDGADAMLTADLQIFFGSHIPALCTEFKARKIYADGDCPTLPSSTGSQKTTVVLARFNDAGLPNAPLTSPQVGTLVNDMSAYLSENSFTKATLGAPSIRGWLDLGKSRAHYYDQATGNMLVDLVQDVITKVHATDASFDFSNVDRLIIVTNDDGSGGETRGQREWATTGPWPYAIPSGAGSKRFSASVHTFQHTRPQFEHALGHHFGMFDLYPHEGVSFPRPYADGWSNMAKDAGGSFKNVHSLAWDKLKPGWLGGANVQFIPRPPADPDPAHRFEQTFPIFRDETASGNPVVLQIGTTPGAADRSAEHVSYYVEARKKSGSYDSQLASDAVLVYYVNEDIGQGFGPLRLVDATPGTSNDLSDAGLLPAPAPHTTVSNVDSIGLDVEVLPKTGAEDYRVHVTYDPPETQNDVYIHPHDGNWQSPDIWVDSPACNSGTCGFDLDGGRSELDRGDQPRPGVVNRLYARIFNHGPATAHNVRVDFYLSEPYHGLDGGDTDPDTGGDIAFNEHFFTVITDLPVTETGLPVFVNWTPSTPPSGDVHTCVKVKIASVFNDTNAANQASQENINAYDLTSHSPYPPAIDDFRVANPYDHPIFVYLRADDVPVGWTADIVPDKAYLAVGGSVNARMTIQAPLSYPVCSTEFVKATGWYPAGDTLVPLGASVAEVNLKKSTDLTVVTHYQDCKHRPETNLAAAPAATTGNGCHEISTQGCTVPPQPFQHITLTYTGPDGKPIYHDVVTDKNGCFEDFLVNPQGGAWQVESEYQGSVCTARTHGRPQGVEVPPNGGTPGDGGGVPPGVRARLWYSLHLGMSFPRGSFAESFEPGPSISADFEYQISDRVSLEALYGYHFFHDRAPSGASSSQQNLAYRNLSLNARAYLPFGWARFYLQAGPGLYDANPGSTSGGLNVGIGFSFPLHTNFRAQVGSDLHVVDPGGTKRLFLDHTLGVAFRF